MVRFVGLDVHKPGVRKAAVDGQTEAPGRSVPSLAEVYESEGLPSPKQLSPGERQVVEKLELIDFIHRINNRQRILRSVV